MRAIRTDPAGEYLVALERIGVETPQAVASALATLPALTPEQTAMLAAARAAGTVEWYLLSLRDNAADDGDVVAVRTTFVAASVPLREMPHLLVLPVSQGEPIRIEGIRDGGGGITVEIAALSGVLHTAPMTAGEHVLLHPR